MTNMEKTPFLFYIMPEVCGIFLLNSCYKSVPVIVTIIDDPHYFAHSCPKSTYLYKIHEILTNVLRPISRTNGPILRVFVRIWIWLQIFEASCKGFCLFVCLFSVFLQIHTSTNNTFSPNSKISCNGAFKISQSLLNPISIMCIRNIIDQTLIFKSSTNWLSTGHALSAVLTRFNWIPHCNLSGL